MNLLRRFIREHPDSWVALLTFIHGGPSTDRTIFISAVAGAGFPVSHTCSGTLDLRNYNGNYERFSQELQYAIENTVGLHLV
jgi:hypothetical protein